MKATNHIIHDLREDRDLRQSDVATVIGTTQQHYSRCEKGESDFSLRAIDALADYYQVSADYLLGRTDCRQGIDVLNQQITPEHSVGKMLTDVLSLSLHGRNAVLEYIHLQKIKETVEHTKSK